jgi:aminomethyltransferase
MAKITRSTALSCRHRDLGAELQEYIRMGVPMKYSTDPRDEHDAVRDAAGLYDMTPFLKFYVKGPDAEAVLNHAVTFDVSKVKPGQSKYGPFLRENGTICDDGILFNNGSNEYLVVHGDGCARNMAEASAEGKDAYVEYAAGLHLLSLQGPKAVELLDQHTPIDLPRMKYFHHQETEVFGCPCILSRTGFSGERGYEMFVSPHLVCDLWDNILSYGKEMGVMPCSLSSVFPLRMEAGLLWRRFDLMENTPWEVDMGWVVHRNKGDFRGKDALMKAEGKERFKVCGIEVDLDHALAGGEKIMIEGKEVGIVHDKPAYSHRMKKSLALVRVDPEVANIGTKLEIVGEGGSCTATIVKFPVYDPEKKRTHEVN